MGFKRKKFSSNSKSPFGNFIAFPIEIMRTGNHIYTQAIDEMTTGIGKGTWNNPEFKELNINSTFIMQWAPM